MCFGRLNVHFDSDELIFNTIAGYHFFVWVHIDVTESHYLFILVGTLWYPALIWGLTSAQPQWKYVWWATINSKLLFVLPRNINGELTASRRWKICKNFTNPHCHALRTSRSRHLQAKFIVRFSCSLKIRCILAEIYRDI